MPTTTGTFASKLSISTLRHHSRNTFLFYEMYILIETRNINCSTLSKPNSYSLITLCCCGCEFKYLSFPKHTRLPIGQFLYLCTLIYISNPQFSLIYNNSCLTFLNCSFVCRIFLTGNDLGKDILKSRYLVISRHL